MTLKDAYGNTITDLGRPCLYFKYDTRLIHRLDLYDKTNGFAIEGYSIVEDPITSSGDFAIIITHPTIGTTQDVELVYTFIDAMIAKSGFEVAFYIGTPFERNSL